MNDGLFVSASANAVDTSRRCGASSAYAAASFARYASVIFPSLRPYASTIACIDCEPGHRRLGRFVATTEQAEAILLQRRAGTWTPRPPAEDDDPEYHRLYELCQQETG